MTTRKLAVAALSLGVAATLAGCAAGSSSHVVQGTGASASVSTTVPPTSSTVPAGTGSTTPAGRQPSGASSSGALSATTLNQVAAELGTLDANLSAANNDLNNPQGDS